MFEAWVHPVILLGKFHDLFLKKFIRAAWIDRVTPNGKSVSGLEIVTLYPGSFATK
jgi:hypothetical protein